MEIPGLVNTLSNAVLMALWAIFYTSTLARRFSMKATVAGWMLCFALWLMEVSLTPVNSPLRIFGGLVINLAPPFVLYKSRWLHTLFAVGVALACMFVGEFLLILLFSHTKEALVGGMDTLPLTVQLSSYLFFLPCVAVLLFVCARLFNRYRTRLPPSDWRLFVLFPASQVVAGFSWYTMATTGMSAFTLLWQLAALLFSLGADVALYVAMRGLAQRAALQAEKDLLAKQIEGQREHYAALTSQYESIRRMRHDIDNHLKTMHILLENGRHEEAAAYAAQVRQADRQQSELGACRNPVLDAYLYQRCAELRAQGVDIEARVELPEELEIGNVDLVSAFGNLVDNAAEACRDMEGPRVRLLANVLKGHLVIVTENPLPAPRDGDKARRIPELERGVGFHILRELAEKYAGEFTAGAADGVFRSELILRVGTEAQG